MVFTLQNPESSLKVLQGILSELGKISGYKINETKSVLMGINIAKEMREWISEWTVIPWKNKIRYLGINLAAPLDHELLQELS